MVRPLCSSTISETLFHDVLQVPLSKKPCSALAAREQGSFSQIPLWSYRPLPIVFLHREPRRLHRPRDRRTSDPYRKIPDGILTPFRLGIKGRFILSFLGDGIALFDFSSCTILLDTAAYYRRSIQKVAKCPNWFRADQIEDEFLISARSLATASFWSNAPRLPVTSKSASQSYFASQNVKTRYRP